MKLEHRTNNNLSNDNFIHLTTNKTLKPVIINIVFYETRGSADALIINIYIFYGKVDQFVGCLFFLHISVSNK